MSRPVDETLERILPGVTKPARYTGGELNAIVKDHAACEVRFALAFPDVYEIGMSNLALAILYHMLNGRPDCAAERVYAPWPDMEGAMREVGLPLYTLETHTPVAEYDLLGFSLAYEMADTNVLNMLDLAGLPVRSADRDTGTWPLVIAGGHCATNPEPMAPFIDAFVIGEAEAVLHGLVDTWKACRALPRSRMLRRLADLPGVYVPRFFEPAYTPAAKPAEGPDTRLLASTAPAEPGLPARVDRQYAADLDALDFPTQPVVSYIEAVHDRISLEVMRGCTRGCRFCQAGFITRPVRERSPDRVFELAGRLVEGTGHEEISLVSLSTADHTGVREMVGGLAQRYEGDRVGISLPSLRADTDCVALAADVQKVRKSGLTFAPEAGSQRLRDVINKNVTEGDLFAAVEAAFTAGWRHVKLYFMLGLPTETDEDVLAIADLAERVLKTARRAGCSGATVSVSASTFVPKPGTPFQWHPQDPVEETQRKQALLKQAVRSRAIKLRWHDARMSHVEAALARGDRRVADAIEAAWRAGARFDTWGDWFSYERWVDAFASAGLRLGHFANRPRTYDEALPWDHVASGVSKAYLRAEDQRARRGQVTCDCHTGPCTFCQACERAITERPNRPL